MTFCKIILAFHCFCPYTDEMKKQQKAGRPLKSVMPLTDRLEIRLEPGEKAVYDRAADAAGMERSDWIRAVLNDAAKKALSRK
jgi:hypothetical protein